MAAILSQPCKTSLYGWNRQCPCNVNMASFALWTGSLASSGWSLCFCFLLLSPSLKTKYFYCHTTNCVMAKYDQSKRLNIRLVLFRRYMTKTVSFLCTHLDWTSDNKFVGKRQKFYLHLAQSWWTWWKSVGSGLGYWFLIANGNHKVNTLNRMGGRPSTRDTEETHTDEAENNQLIFEHWVNYSTTFVPFSERWS